MSTIVMNDIHTGADRYSILVSLIEKKITMPIFESSKQSEQYQYWDTLFEMPEGISEKSCHCLTHYKHSKFLRRCETFIAEDNQAGGMLYDEEKKVVKTVVFQNNQRLRISLRKRGKKKAMITMEAFLSNLDDPAYYLDRLLRGLDDHRITTKISLSPYKAQLDSSQYQER